MENLISRAYPSGIYAGESRGADQLVSAFFALGVALIFEATPFSWVTSTLTPFLDFSTFLWSFSRSIFRSSPLGVT